MKKNARAQATAEVLFILTEIILVIAAGFIVFQKVNSIDNDQIFLKKFFSRDLALAINSIELLQGNVFYLYNTKGEKELLSGLTFKFGNGFVDVNGDKYPVASKNLNPAVISAPETRLRLTKIDGNLSVEEDKAGIAPKLKFNTYALDCSNFKSAKLSSVAVDAGHGFSPELEKGFKGDAGFTGSAGQESLLVADVSANLMMALKNKGFSVMFTRNPELKNPEDAKSTEDRKSAVASADAVISLHLNSDHPDVNDIKAFVNYDSLKYSESFKLACLIVNGLSDTFNSQISGAAVVPVRISQLNSDEPKQLLEPNKIAVLVELGNINSPKSFVKELQKVGDSISKAAGELSR